MRGNSKGRYTFLMLAGFYLMYLGWQLLSGFISGEATSPVFPIASVFFFVIGILIVVSNIREIIRVSKEETEGSTENEDPAEEAEKENVDEPKQQEEAPKAPLPAKENASLFDRASLGALSEEEMKEAPEADQKQAD